MLSTAAFNALLKTLEEPPSHALFILATTEIHKIPATVLSRCQRHEFRRIPVADIVRQLRISVRRRKHPCRGRSSYPIARQAAGGMRDAISLLDQLASSGQTITLALAQTVLGAATGQAVLDLIDALLGVILLPGWTTFTLPWTLAPIRASSHARSWNICASCCWCRWAMPPR